MCFNPSPVRRVPSPNRYIAVAKFCFCKNNKRLIERKQGKFEKCKVRLVVQGQHMHRKDEQGRGDFEDAFSPVPHASGFRMILALATQNNMHCDHVDISQQSVRHSFKVICSRETAIMGRFISLVLQVTMRTLIMSISCADLFTVCQVPLELGITL